MASHKKQVKAEIRRIVVDHYYEEFEEVPQHTEELISNLQNLIDKTYG